jgi:hypothetical protein
VRGLVLACGDAADALPTADDAEVRKLPPRPGKTDVDPWLADLLVVAGTDADLAAVVLRLLRRDALTTTRVGYVPTERRSPVARLWGVPADPGAALELALSGAERPVTLVRDDAGGVLLGSGHIPRVRGVAYCDDTVALRGAARSISVRPGDGGLVVTVTGTGLLRRGRTFRSRAFPLACDPLIPVPDGVPYPRTVERWTWYRHTEDLRAIRVPG